MSDNLTLSRRNLLGLTAWTIGAAGFAAAAWPFIDQMNPDAGTVAAGDDVYVDVTRLAADTAQLVRWRHRPVFVVSRSQAALDALRGPELTARLADPDSDARQQPPYARNWHRSLKPGVGIVVGVCTRCACVLRHVAADASAGDAFDRAGQFMCLCCGSRFDMAGRAGPGPARFNLAVPPHSFDGGKLLRIGRNPPGEVFVFGSVERG